MRITEYGARVAKDTRRVSSSSLGSPLNIPTVDWGTDLLDSTTVENVNNNYAVDMLITAVPSSDHSASGPKITLTANEAQAFGDLTRINSSGKAQIADASVIATADALFMAIATISANSSGTYLVLGIARDDTWNWTVGGQLFLSLSGTSGNTLTQTAPTGVDEVIQIVGVAMHANRIMFTPQLTQVEHI